MADAGAAAASGAGSGGAAAPAEGVKGPVEGVNTKLAEQMAQMPEGLFRTVVLFL
eukprot:CAMPEP_0171464524 /NCGR_PEP_ID=MMETSP0945-20130129/7814_1 /TAXON_ID=109269 /ORGANISM="Vaucheria litorea, Strain CCMP2940" /LENGTH=54 /DNA_ID=CAMNT_0011991641 /DNA_START=74 /DNA_END=238 /DNA_ORIENTATION=+